MSHVVAVYLVAQQLQHSADVAKMLLAFTPAQFEIDQFIEQHVLGGTKPNRILSLAGDSFDSSLLRLGELG